MAKMLRLFDVLLAAMGLLIGLPLMVLLTLVGYWETGSPLFRQQRVGYHGQPFVLLKFRTMKCDTGWVASHLVDASSITRFGRFLRRTKLDELPQLWNVLKGDMSLVGPRPCLLSQYELIKERTERGVYDARPGITGLAQLNAIDMSTPRRLAEVDQQMLAAMAVPAYFRYLFLTLLGKGGGDRVKMKKM
ncbi:sugar transferase [Halomonas sp. Bachu 37]|uniref:sugar transferase n=1 Tax=Halomonas kashgarensis TaxID=3084920 RepID=UPI00321633B2